MNQKVSLEKDEWKEVLLALESQIEGSRCELGYNCELDKDVIASTKMSIKKFQRMIKKIKKQI